MIKIQEQQRSAKKEDKTKEEVDGVRILTLRSRVSEAYILFLAAVREGQTEASQREERGRKREESAGKRRNEVKRTRDEIKREESEQQSSRQAMAYIQISPDVKNMLRHARGRGRGNPAEEKSVTKNERKRGKWEKRDE